MLVLRQAGLLVAPRPLRGLRLGGPPIQVGEPEGRDVAKVEDYGLPLLFLLPLLRVLLRTLLRARRRLLLEAFGNVADGAPTNWLASLEAEC